MLPWLTFCALHTFHLLSLRQITFDLEHVAVAKVLRTSTWNMFFVVSYIHFTTMCSNPICTIDSSTRTRLQVLLNIAVDFMFSRSFRHVLSLDRLICLPSAVDSSRFILLVLPSHIHFTTMRNLCDCHSCRRTPCKHQRAPAWLG